MACYIEVCRILVGERDQDLMGRNRVRQILMAMWPLQNEAAYDGNPFHIRLKCLFGGWVQVALEREAWDGGTADDLREVAEAKVVGN